MQIIDNIPVWGTSIDEGALKQIKTCYYIFGHAALMADHHKGYGVPIGGVIAHETLVSPSGIGYDIGCGNKAVLTDAPAEDVRKNIAKIMDDVFRTVSFGLSRTNRDEVVEHDLFENDDAWQITQGANSAAWRLTSLRDQARAQLGTVGSGNHYVDIFEDELRRIWIGVHFGSRGFGHKIATLFLNRAGAKDDMDSAPVALDADSNEGQDYIAAMKLAGRYAYAGRDWVCQRVAKILGAKIREEIHNHHNFAWREEHAGETFWVIRKGATPAFPGQKGFIGGSMGDDAVIIEGTDSALAREALYSTVHGAGRVMSRTAAKGKYVNEGGKRIRKEGLVRHDAMMKWLHDKSVALRGGDLDEAPQAYRRLPEVLEAHAGTIRILHTLRPIGVAMAGRDIFDPYKD